MRKEPDPTDDLRDISETRRPARKGLMLGLTILAAALLVALSVALSVVIMESTADKTEYATPDQLAALTDQLNQLNARLTEREKHLDLMIKAIPAMNSKIENSSGVTMQKLMLDQEKSIQEFIKGLKSGMYDLANMIPGSRTWLEQYNDEMNKALQKSVDRTRELTRLDTGTVLVEPGSK